MPVQRLKVAVLLLDLPCSGPITHSGEILTTGKSHGKKPDIKVVPVLHLAKLYTGLTLVYILFIAVIFSWLLTNC